MKLLIYITLFLTPFGAFCQSKYINIPIESKDPFKIEIWAINEETNQSDWYDIRETGLECAKGWYFTEEINIIVERYQVLYFRFKTGSSSLNCEEYTYLTLNGGRDRHKIKDKPDKRVRVVLDGSRYELGNEIEKPTKDI